MRRSSGSRAVRFRVLVAERTVNGGAARAAVLDDPRLELLEEVGHAAAAVARAVALKPDVLVLEEGLSGGAIAAAVEIGARMPDLPLLITHGPEEDGLVEVLAAGASAYVSSARADEDLADVIVDVARGNVVLSGDQVARVVEELRDPTRPRRRLEHLPELTAREWQILDLLHSELSTPQIAKRLVLSPITVRSHARSIRNKLERRTAVPH
jgi:two-component system NarL family response regulator